MKNQPAIFLLFLSMTLQTLAFGKTAQTGVRYYDEVFDKISIQKNIVYARRPNLNGQMQDLKLDIYSPENDTLAQRPLVVFMHGGGYMIGSKEDDYAVEFCKSFAKRGYVTVSMNYRLGVSGYTPVAFGEAIYRGTQDARKALQFLVNQSNTYRIDESKVYLGGGSAGAINALHAAYWQQQDIPFYLDAQKLGPLSEAATKTVKIKGVLNCWGAVVDTGSIREGNAAVVSVHGDRDSVVPYKSMSMGPYAFYGSYFIHERAVQLGIKSKLHVFANGGHGLLPSDTARWDTVVNVIRDFLFELTTEEDSVPVKDSLVNGLGINAGQTRGAMKVFPNPVQERLQISNERTALLQEIQLMTIKGDIKANYRLNLASRETFTAALPQLPAGVYFLKAHWKDGSTETKKIVVQDLN